MCLLVCVFMYVSTFMLLLVCVYMYVFTCMCLHVCVHFHVTTCMCLHVTSIDSPVPCVGSRTGMAALESLVSIENRSL